MHQFLLVVVVATIMAGMPVAQHTGRICLPNTFTATGVNNGNEFDVIADLENQRVYAYAKPDILLDKNVMKKYTFKNDSTCTWANLRGYALYYQCIPQGATELDNPREFINQRGVRTWGYNADPNTRIEMTLNGDHNPLMTTEISEDNLNETFVNKITWKNLKITPVDVSVFHRDVSNCYELDDW